MELEKSNLLNELFSQIEVEKSNTSPSDIRLIREVNPQIFNDIDELSNSIRSQIDEALNGKKNYDINFIIEMQRVFLSLFNSIEKDGENLLGYGKKVEEEFNNKRPRNKIGRGFSEYFSVDYIKYFSNFVSEREELLQKEKKVINGTKQNLLFGWSMFVVLNTIILLCTGKIFFAVATVFIAIFIQFIFDKIKVIKLEEINKEREKILQNLLEKINKTNALKEISLFQYKMQKVFQTKEEKIKYISELAKDFSIFEKKPRSYFFTEEGLNLYGDYIKENEEKVAKIKDVIFKSNIDDYLKGVK